MPRIRSRDGKCDMPEKTRPERGTSLAAAVADGLCLAKPNAGREPILSAVDRALTDLWGSTTDATRETEWLVASRAGVDMLLSWGSEGGPDGLAAERAGDLVPYPIALLAVREILAEDGASGRAYPAPDTEGDLMTKATLSARPCGYAAYRKAIRRSMAPILATAGTVIRRFPEMLGTVSIEEAAAWAAMGLSSGAKKWDPETVPALDTYVRWWMKMAIVKHAESLSPHPRRELNVPMRPRRRGLSDTHDAW